MILPPRQQVSQRIKILNYVDLNKIYERNKLIPDEMATKLLKQGLTMFFFLNDIIVATINKNLTCVNEEYTKEQINESIVIFALNEKNAIRKYEKIKNT